MKKILIILVAVFSVTALQAQEAKKYVVKSGYIKLELSGNTEGTKEIWWDDYGAKTRELEKSTTTTKMFGIKNVEEKHMLTILDKGTYWTVNYIEEEGYTGKVQGYDDAQEIANSMSEADREAYTNNLLESMGGRNLGTENVNGYNCEVFTVMGAKSWVYKGITIKSEAKIMGIESNEIFTLFKPGMAVPSSKFVAPTDVQYEDLTAKQQGFFQGLNEMQTYDELNEDEEETVPVKYPYEKFKKVIAGFSHTGYSNMGVNSVEGIHAASFVKGSSSSITIIAQSRKNADEGDHDGFETFTHKGQRCYFGKVEEENGTALIVEYPNYDMYIVIATIPGTGKSDLLTISDKLKF